MTIWGIALCFVFMNSRTPIKDSYSLRLSPWRRTKLDCASRRCNKECMLPAVHKREEVTILRMRGSPPRGDVHGVEGHAVISKYTPKNGVDCGGPGNCFVRVAMVPTPCVEPVPLLDQEGSAQDLVYYDMSFCSSAPSTVTDFVLLAHVRFCPFWIRNTKANAVSFTSYLMEG